MSSTLIRLPTDFGRLPLQCAEGHGVELAPDEIRQIAIKPAGCAPQHLAGDDRQRVAGVQCRGRAVRRRESGPAPTHLAAVGYIVVDEKGVVQQFDCDGDPEKIVGSRAECATRRQTQRRTQRLAGP